MAALGWLLNLGFAGGGAAEPEPEVSDDMRRYRRWASAVVYAHGAARPAGRVTVASYGAGVTTPGTPVWDVLIVTEAQMQTAPHYRVPVNLVRFAPGTPVPSYYRLISESTGEVVL